MGGLAELRCFWAMRSENGSFRSYGELMVESQMATVSRGMVERKMANSKGIPVN
jgi:hypothetical protein